MICGLDVVSLERCRKDEREAYLQFLNRLDVNDIDIIAIG
jgi:hypothetical protein